VLPFVLIGIGVDDMFVLITALEGESSDLPVAERMGRTMGRAGVSITITSLTDLFAFILGSTSALPALSDFCAFAAVGITADFLLQISFFAGWMALDCYRENKNKPDCCPCLCSSQHATKAAQAAESGCCCCTKTYGLFPFTKWFDGPDAGLKAFLRNYYIPLLRRPLVKALVIVIFVGYCAFSAVFAAKLKQDFQYRWFVNDDATLQRAFDVQDEYFSSTGLPVSIVTPASSSFDYTTIAGQQKLVALGAAVGSNVWIESGSLSSWYSAFREWVHACNGGGGAAYCTAAKDGTAQTKFVVDTSGATLAASAQLADSFVPPAHFWGWLDQFLTTAPLGGAYSSQVAWTSSVAVRGAAEAALGVQATRMRADYVYTDSADDQVESMRSLRESVASAGVTGAFPFMFPFLFYEQYAIIVREALTNLGLALLAVFVITLLIIANFGATALVMLVIVMVDVDILGLMYLWDLTIDSVAIINLVLAIGLSVDYAAHIAHAFVQTPGTRQERADKALEEMGTAVVHGAFSTFLAVVILSTSKSYVFRIFFKQFFGICVFGAAHGLCLLPVVLSLVGPSYVDAGTPKKVPAGSKGLTTSEMTVMATGSIQVGSTPATSPPPSAPASDADPSESPPNFRQIGRGNARVAPAAQASAPHVV